MSQGKQMEMFPPSPPTKDELLDAQLAEMRLEGMRRDETKPGHRGRRRAGRPCPKCGHLS